MKEADTLQRSTDAVKRLILFGHVDHGKSTLAGHLLYLTGNVDNHEVEKASRDAEGLKMSRWKWAYLLDTSPEERVKGKTHEFSVFPFSYLNEQFELIDTPGHQTFVRETIAALGRYPDATGVLVVSAIPNEFISGFERGMTKEQCILARALGVQNIIVAVNKMDAVGFSEDVSKNMREVLEPFLKKKLHYKQVRFIPVSAYDGVNLLDILVDIPHTPRLKTKGSGPTTLSNVHRLKAQILRCDNLISAGYTCVAHIGADEHLVTVLHLKNKTFVRTGETCEMKLQFPDKIPLELSTRIVLRASDYTIGFGVTC